MGGDLEVAGSLDLATLDGDPAGEVVSEPERLAPGFAPRRASEGVFPPCLRRVSSSILVVFSQTIHYKAKCVNESRRGYCAEDEVLGGSSDDDEKVGGSSDDEGKIYADQGLGGEPPFYH